MLVLLCLILCLLGSLGFFEISVYVSFPIFIALDIAKEGSELIKGKTLGRPIAIPHGGIDNADLCSLHMNKTVVNCVLNGKPQEGCLFGLADSDVVVSIGRGQLSSQEDTYRNTRPKACLSMV